MVSQLKLYNFYQRKFDSPQALSNEEPVIPKENPNPAQEKDVECVLKPPASAFVLPRYKRRRMQGRIVGSLRILRNLDEDEEEASRKTDVSAGCSSEAPSPVKGFEESENVRESDGTSAVETEMEISDFQDEFETSDESEGLMSFGKKGKMKRKGKETKSKKSDGCKRGNGRRKNLG
eukprot:TRINITY_DN40321_c0_g1_i1.p1 TRINITY_DN40321_c0_g1~~TRINITY_DN40321_c0_g1_i1.p1  ORF type:complete len:177 (+),score=34.84 TRINITY_DN40321_c0_g1_i1:96-626(+)